MKAVSVRDVRDRSLEWLEADGLGGFASGTVPLIRTRRYHALLLAASTPPAGRFALVNGLEVWAETPDGTIPLSSQLYGPDVVHPDGAERISRFEPEPWPRWELTLPNGTIVDHEVFARHGALVVVLSWRLREPRRPVRLMVRPLLSGRDPHALHRENPAFRFDADLARDGWV